MRTVNIPYREWGAFLDGFSAMHEGWLATLEVRPSTNGILVEAHDLPLNGITFESSTQTITIATIASAAERLTRIIHEPTAVHIDRTLEGADAALHIDSRDGSTTLRFRAPALPETVDGVVGHVGVSRASDTRTSSATSA